MTKITLKTKQTSTVPTKIGKFVLPLLSYLMICGQWVVHRLLYFKFSLDYVSDDCMKIGTHTSAPLKDSGEKIMHTRGGKKNHRLWVWRISWRDGICCNLWSFPSSSKIVTALARSSVNPTLFICVITSVCCSISIWRYFSCQQASRNKWTPQGNP